MYQTYQKIIEFNAGTYLLFGKGFVIQALFLTKQHIVAEILACNYVKCDALGTILICSCWRKCIAQTHKSLQVQFILKLLIHVKNWFNAIRQPVDKDYFFISCYSSFFVICPHNKRSVK